MYIKRICSGFKIHSVGLEELTPVFLSACKLFNGEFESRERIGIKILGAYKRCRNDILIT